MTITPPSHQWNSFHKHSHTQRLRHVTTLFTCNKFLLHLFLLHRWHIICRFNVFPEGVNMSALKQFGSSDITFTITAIKLVFYDKNQIRLFQTKYTSYVIPEFHSRPRYLGCTYLYTTEGLSDHRPTYHEHPFFDGFVYSFSIGF